MKIATSAAVMALLGLGHASSSRAVYQTTITTLTTIQSTIATATTTVYTTPCTKTIELTENPFCATPVHQSTTTATVDCEGCALVTGTVLPPSLRNLFPGEPYVPLAKRQLPCADGIGTRTIDVTTEVVCARATADVV